MSERYLANENFPASIVRWLRDRGDDCIHAAESMVGESDERILEAARADNRVLLTLDRDFGTLVFHARQPAAPGIVLFRPGNGSPPAMLRLMMTFFGPSPALRGSFTVVTQKGFRQARLAERRD